MASKAAPTGLGARFSKAEDSAATEELKNMANMAKKKAKKVADFMMDVLGVLGGGVCVYERERDEVGWLVVG